MNFEINLITETQQIVIVVFGVEKNLTELTQSIKFNVQQKSITVIKGKLSEFGVDYSKVVAFNVREITDDLRFIVNRGGSMRVVQLSNPILESGDNLIK